MYKRRAVFMFFLAIAFLVLPALAAAQGLVPCTGIDCQACNIIDLANNVINFLLGLSIPIFIGLFAYAGVLYFTSAAKESNISDAKKIFRTALTGFVIALLAYLIVETLLHAVLSEKYWKGWNQIECVAQSQRLTNKTVGDLFGAPTQPTGTTTGILPGGKGFSSQVGDQAGDASSALNTLMNCMANKTSGTISSISDRLIASGSKTWAQCRAGQCAHVANSCHYGGRTCEYKSYAFDVVGNNAQLIAAARSCGADTLVHSTHVHVSIGEAYGCGCDAGLD